MAAGKRNRSGRQLVTLHLQSADKGWKLVLTLLSTAGNCASHIYGSVNPFRNFPHGHAQRFVY